MMIGRRTPRLLPARLRGLAAATLALAALVVGLGAAPAIAAVAPGKGAISVSPAFAADAVASQSVIATLGDSLAMANEVLTSIRPMTLAGFKPGNIISDRVFYNNGTMSEAQIQEFLNSKVPRCQSGYVCLRDFRQDTSARAASAMCSAYAPANGESAARIIWRVSQACGINPQVILVTLQKEQGLVTHTWPSDYRYRAAMGQGCPDTAACDTAYYGFFNQVYGAAAQFKRYSNPPGTSNYFNWYAPGKTWGLRFHPNVACGSTPVFVENQATANLYYFTPYQPNPAAIAAGYAEANDACSSYGNRNFYNYFTDWFGSTQVARSAKPVGSLELVESVPGEFRVAGWALEPAVTSPLAIHVYVDGKGYARQSSLTRPDVGGAFPAAGSGHGFDARVPNNGPGNATICVYAISSGAGDNTLLGCTIRTAKSGSPFGAVDSVRGVPGGITTSGWTIDPDTAGSIPVHIYVGTVGVAVAADGKRNDVAAAFAGYGAAHGFNSTVPAEPGLHSVCTYAINKGPGLNVLLGCTNVTVPATSDLGRPPSGSLESLVQDRNKVSLVGWALDPDTAAPINIQVSVGAITSLHLADRTRADVGAVYPVQGPNHGFSVQVELPVGWSDVCVTAVNNTAVGGNTELGCRRVLVDPPPPAPGANRDPIGNIEAVTATSGGVTVTGWALDPDTPNPIMVHIYVGSQGYAISAEKARPDVAAAYPGYGAEHGYTEVLPAASGKQQVCVYLINATPGHNPMLGCREVVVP